ncbi:MAG: hypothetical protein ACFFCE_06070 [Promethearchaeota archaeon]
MLELKELLEKREAHDQERAQKIRKEELPEYKGYKFKNKNRRFLELYKRAEFNPRYYEEYEQFLRRKEVLREYYRQFSFF